MVPFTEDVVLPSIPQSTEYLAFDRLELYSVFLHGVYEEVSENYSGCQVDQGRMVYSSFTVKEGEGA